jgi:transcriptional regulator of acetoin/glycerol metabolism
VSGVQRTTKTWDSAEHTSSSESHLPRLIRFFRADDPFDATESFALSEQDSWSIGRLDGERSSALEKGRIWSYGDAIMSSSHATVSAVADGWLLADTGSKNGTFVDGVRLLKPQLLHDGAIIECGHSFFLYRERNARSTSGYAPRGVPLDFPPLQYQIGPLLPFITSDVSLHLQGETGTGKEVVARAIHGISGRRGAFIARNCAAIPETLFESELFGHVKGAFSGATSDRPGQIIAADGGTLFLDEIGELSLAMQAKLLRALELKEVLPLGARAPLRVDFRLVSATLCDLEARVKAGRFRQDLYGRLGRNFTVPALRDHKEELGRMVQVFLAARLTARLKSSQPNPIVYFTLAASRALVHYAWPYNIRELKQCVDSAFICALDAESDSSVCAIDLAHLPAPLLGGPSSGLRPGFDDAAAKFERPEGRERACSDTEILAALERAQDNRARAAKLLGISERTVFRRIRKLRDAK